MKKTQEKGTFKYRQLDYHHMTKKELFELLQQSELITNERVINEYQPMLDMIADKIDMEVENYAVIVFNENSVALSSIILHGSRRAVMEFDMNYIIKKILEVPNGHGVVLLHNHPIYPLELSDDDVIMARNLAAAMTICGLTVMDCLVINKGRFCSLFTNFPKLFIDIEDKITEIIGNKFKIFPPCESEE